MGIVIMSGNNKGKRQVGVYMQHMCKPLGRFVLVTSNDRGLPSNEALAAENTAAKKRKGSSVDEGRIKPPYC